MPTVAQEPVQESREDHSRHPDAAGSDRPDGGPELLVRVRIGENSLHPAPKQGHGHVDGQGLRHDDDADARMSRHDLRDDGVRRGGREAGVEDADRSGVGFEREEVRGEAVSEAHRHQGQLARWHPTLELGEDQGMWREEVNLYGRRFRGQAVLSVVPCRRKPCADEMDYDRDTASGRVVDLEQSGIQGPGLKNLGGYERRWVAGFTSDRWLPAFGEGPSTPRSVSRRSACRIGLVK